MHNYTKFCFTYFFTSTPHAHIPKSVGYLQILSQAFIAGMELAVPIT